MRRTWSFRYADGSKEETVERTRNWSRARNACIVVATDARTGANRGIVSRTYAHMPNLHQRPRVGLWESGRGHCPIWRCAIEDSSFLFFPSTNRSDRGTIVARYRSFGNALPRVVSFVCSVVCGTAWPPPVETVGAVSGRAPADAQRASPCPRVAFARNQTLPTFRDTPEVRDRPCRLAPFLPLGACLGQRTRAVCLFVVFLSRRRDTRRYFFTSAWVSSFQTLHFLPNKYFLVYLLLH